MPQNGTWTEEVVAPTQSGKDRYMSVTERETAMDVSYLAQPSQIGEIRRAVADVARTLGAGDTALMQITLAVSEAATNAILHAYRDREEAAGCRVRVVVSTDEAGCLDVSVRDRGVGPAPRPDSPGLGLGLGLMAHETDGLEIRKIAGGGTEVVLRFRL